MKAKRIQSFDTLKFFLACIVVFHHTTGMYLGKIFATNLAVEGFFILSGFLLAQSFYKCEKQNPAIPQHLETICVFIKNKIVKLYPAYAFALIVSLLLSIITRTNLHHARALLFNLFMITENGHISGIVFGSWFISAMLLIELLLFSLMVCKGRIIFVSLLPFLVIFSVFLLGSTIGQVVSSTNDMYLNLIPLTMVRACLGISTGCLLFFICDLLKKTQWAHCQHGNKLLLNIGEIVFSVLCMINLFHRGNSSRDFNIYFCFAFLIGLLYFENERLLEFMSLDIWRRPSQISYMLYLTHGAMLSLLFKYVNFLKKMNYVISRVRTHKERIDITGKRDRESSL